MGAAHPRACGENLCGFRHDVSLMGSSPRMRGKHRSNRARPMVPRLIPAHAGKTRNAVIFPSRSRAHPRACGENIVRHPRCFQEAGSSPRMRGKHDRIEASATSRRLIPAHAGKTSFRAANGRRKWAHPRACGENESVTKTHVFKPGSSPRMRGKRAVHVRYYDKPGLIPAHAGKTLSERVAHVEPWAHPRACGENTERSGVLALRSVRSWKTLSFLSSLKVTHCRAFVQLPFSRIRL